MNLDTEEVGKNKMDRGNCVSPNYILDRVSNRCEMISLAKLIQEKSALS
ncbi:hypothetical protein [Methanosarcina siciliae]|nr:hypothetical protein [Methanosarcina siciliae]